MIRFCLILLTCLGFSTASFADTSPPYWASISAGKARMRTGPGQQFPVVWMYQRAGLPVKVIATYPSWRKIVDPDGTTGWMQANLISDKLAAIVLGDVRPLRNRPEASGKIVWRVAPGVSGAISECGLGWCRFEVAGKAGYIESAHIWGGN